MYTRADLSLTDRLEIFSRYWRCREEHGTVSRLAAEWGVSRRFIYELAERVTEALDWRRAGRPPAERTAQELAWLRQRVRALEADCEQLRGQLELEREQVGAARFRLLLELALCPVSTDKLAHCLAAAFGRAGRCSAGWVSEQLQQAGQAALRLMQAEPLRQAVRELALDEIFRHRQPILMAVEPRTLLALVPQAAANRKGETWQTVLKQYPQLTFVVSDQASGLLKGVNGCGAQLAHQYDLFHFKRELRRLLRTQEARCYEAIEKVERAQKLIAAPRLLSSARVQAVIEYEQQAAVLGERLAAFDWVELILTELTEQLAPYDERRQELRTRARVEATFAEGLELLGAVSALNVKPLLSTIAGASAGLFTFLTVLEEKLERIPLVWRAVAGSRQAVCNALARCWYWRARAHLSVRCQQQYLIALLGLEYWQRRLENFPEVLRQVFEALEQVVRASSAVECLNSLVRPYISVKKHLSQGFLALIALYWNTRPLKQRGDQTPFQLTGIDLGSDDWVELIERELRKQHQQALG